jgi:hypothetical protein
MPERKPEQHEKQRRRKGEGSVYRKASSPFWILQFVHQGRAYIESSETEDEAQGLRQARRVESAGAERSGGNARDAAGAGQRPVSVGERGLASHGAGID